MRDIYYIFTLFCLVNSSVLASPISVFIESHKQLKDLNIEISHTKITDYTDLSKMISFELNWRPVQEHKDFPPRLNLIEFNNRKDKGRNSVIIFSPNQEGVFTADFHIAIESTSNYSLVLWNGQNTVHSLRLDHVINNFKPQGNGWGFESTEQPNKSALVR